MERITLKSGRDIGIRSIRPDDGPRLQDAYARLSSQSRYQRFLVSKPHLTISDTRYLVEVDGCDHVALVATLAEDPDAIIGVGRFVRLPEDRRTAEFAIVVGDPFHGEGIGTELLERLAQAASRSGIARFTATMFAENVAAHRLVHRLSGRLARELHRGPVDEVVVELAS